MFARRAAAEILAGDQSAGAGILRLIEDEGRVRDAVGGASPVIEQEFSEASALDPLQKLFGDNLVGVNVRAIKWGDLAGVFAEWLHYWNRQLRISVKCPAIAAAAAIIGLTKWVRPPRPWRPSKLRLLVEAQRSPGRKISGFMPRHMLQPGSRQSKPAAVKTLSRPSFSAWALTCWEPGTTMARTVVATW